MLDQMTEASDEDQMLVQGAGRALRADYPDASAGTPEQKMEGDRCR
jgi:hypothetical protein